MFWGGAVLLTLFSSVLIFDKTSQNTVLDEVTLKEYADNSNGMFAIMIENEEGEYVEYTDSTSWPTGMVFNTSMSGCIDNNGNTLDNVLSFNALSYTASVSTSETIFCYLYFDNGSFSEYLISTSADSGGTDTTLIEHVEGCDNGCAEDGHYRYSGASEDVNNYICFGTSDLDTCLSDTDTYLFRIIEINPDDGAVKVIKDTALAGDSSYSSYSGTGNGYYWNSTDGTRDTAIMYGSYYNYWAVDDTLYATLAIDLNTIYLNTFSNDWQFTIISYDWNMGGTAFLYAPDEFAYTAMSFYYREANQYAYDTQNFKIGLMNVYDYAYATVVDNWNYPVEGYSSSQFERCASMEDYSNGTTTTFYSGNGIPSELDWLYIKTAEWTITPRIYEAITIITEDGSLTNVSPRSASYSVRPAFYIEGNTLTYSSGIGTATSPYVVSIS